MRIVRFLKKYWYFASLAPLMMIIEVGCDLLLPKFLSQIIDDGALKGNIDLIYEVGLMMIITLLIGGIFSILSSVFTMNASHNYANDLRTALFKKIMEFSFEQVDDFSTGSLVTRITNDVVQVQQMVQMSMRFVIRVAMMLFGGIFMMLSLNVQFSMVIGIAFPIIFIFIFFVLKKANPYFSQVQQRIDDVNTVVEENVNGARVIKAYVKEDYEFDRFNQANINLSSVQLKVSKLFALMAPFMTLLMNIMVVIVIFVGGYQIEAQNMGIGEVLAGISYITIILMSIMMVGMLFQIFSRAKASAKRLNAILDLTPTIVSGSVEESDNLGTLEFNNVTFCYPGSKEAVLENINFSLAKGETLGILGSTGSGKSTLVNLITRFYDVTKGEILVDGINVKDYNLYSLRDKVSIVLQKAELYSKTLLENITFGQEISEENLLKACKTAQALDFINNTPDKFSTVVAEKGASLSGGQKQRIAISRALAHSSEFLIFDDSTSALDLKTESMLLKGLKEEYKDYTKIIVAQRISSVKDCDKIIVLEDGVIASMGNHDELINNSEIYQDIYYSQINKGGAANE